MLDIFMSLRDWWFFNLSFKVVLKKKVKKPLKTVFNPFD